MSLWEISAVGAGGRSARGGASGRKGLREEGRGGTWEGAKSEGWSGRSDESLDAETEENRMPTGELVTQESREGGLRVDVLAGGID